MAFLSHTAPAKQRFSLLVLQPGELYFQDYSVFFHPDAALADDGEAAMKRKIRGRLKICSSSLVFDPQDVADPMLKFPLEDCSSVAEWKGQLRATTDVFVIVCSRIIEMLANNVIAPYQVRRERRAYKFSLNFAPLKEVLPRVENLLRIQRLRVSQREAQLSQVVRDMQRNTTFDPSWLVDLYEKRLLEYSGVRVTPLVTNPGQIVLTNSRLYFQPYNNVDPDPVTVFPLAQMTRIVKRRFMQRQVGLEIFLKPANSLVATARQTVDQVFFSFHDRVERDTMYNIIMQQEALKSLEEEDTQNYTLRWQNGLISNYDYLLYLNSMADRTINDLTQYPVFPWVIQDFTSSTLDLNNPAVFRDLSKPIGALDPDRLSVLKQRYREMPEPKFLYGTHYSTPGYVLYYLVRTAPQYMLCLQNGRFDTADRLFYSIPATWSNVLHNPTDVKELIPEFYAPIEDEEDGLQSNFLVNGNGLDLGVRQNQKKVNDVELPPWATDSRDFLRKHREALESPYVSKRLHEWIDLIFGYKQRGDEAVKANNLFYYLTYEGAIDLDAITDPAERAALELQINEFGQTPKQLFKVPHPRRVAITDVDRVIPLSVTPSPPVLKDGVGSNSSSSSSKSSARKPSSGAPVPSRLASSSSSSSSPNVRGESFASAAAAAAPEEPALAPLPDDLAALIGDQLELYTGQRSLSVGSSQADAIRSLIPEAPSPAPMPTGGTGQWSKIEQLSCTFNYKIHQKAVSDIRLAPDNATVYSVSQDSSLKIYSLDQKKQTRAINISELALSSCSLSKDGKSIFVGSWDNNIYVYSVAYGRILDTIVGHHDAVACIKLRGSMLVSVSWDSTLRIWDCPMSVGGQKKSQSKVEFSEHETEVKCVDVSTCGRYAVTGGADGMVIFWHLEEESLGPMNSVQAHSNAVNAVCFTADSKAAVTCGQDGFVKIVATNSAEIFSVNAGEPLRCLLADPQFLICGSESGMLRVWELVTGKEIASFKAYSCPVTCLTASANGKTILSGGDDGTVKVWEIPT